MVEMQTFKNRQDWLAARSGRIGGEMVDGKWQPSKDGLGLGKVLDYINVKY